LKTRLFLVCLLVTLIGCASVPIKKHTEPIKTDVICFLEIEAFKNPKVDLGLGRLEIKDLGEPVSPIEEPFSKIILAHQDSLAKELEKRGFKVEIGKCEEPMSLFLKSRVTAYPDSWKYRIIYVSGFVGVQMEIRQQDNLILTLETGAPTGFISPETQIRRLASFIAEKIVESLNERRE